MPADVWRGSRIRLRALEPTDIDTLITTADHDSESERADDAIPFPTTIALARSTHEALTQKDGSDGTFFFVIENDQRTIVGNIATFDCDSRNGCFKYSIVIQRPYWGHGYAQEAVMLVLRYYFRELRYQKVTILIYGFNTRSIRFHERLGFHFEGRLRRMVYTNGHYFDEIYYGLTREEFDNLDPPIPLDGQEIS